MRLALVALLLCACGGRPDEPYTCDVAELESVSGEAPLNCEAIRQNALLTEELLISHGIVPPERMGEVLGTTRLHIRAVPCINGTADAEKTNNCRGGRSYAGSHDVDIGSTTFALLHETLHRWDNIQNPIITPAKSVIESHMGWPLVFYTADLDYQDHFNHDALVDPWKAPAR